MARVKKSAPESTEPEEESQEIPDDEHEAGEEDERESRGRSINQADLVRKAVAAGHEKPATGVPYIKDEFGVDIDPKYYSVAKSQLKKRQAKTSSSEPAKPGRKPRAPVVEGSIAPPEKPRATANGQPDLLAAMEAMKPLISSLGKDQAHRIIDLLS